MPDIPTLVLLLLVLFLGALVSGLAGFAMGVIVLSVWLHFLEPAQCAPLLAGFGLITQGYGVWKLRHAFSWRRILPFAGGSILGVPLGAYLLTRSDPDHVRLGIAALCILYSLYGLAGPSLRVRGAGPGSDGAAGFANGLVGGMTGIVGVIISMWCQMRGWTKDVQRIVFQPIMLLTSVLAFVAIGAGGALNRQTGLLFVLGIPFVFAGTTVGLRLYGRVNEQGFRRIVLALLLLGGVSLAGPVLYRMG